MSEKLKRLLEEANKKLIQKDEDGTVADLGPVPTGHIINKEKEAENE